MTNETVLGNLPEPFICYWNPGWGVDKGDNRGKRLICRVGCDMGYLGRGVQPPKIYKQTHHEGPNAILYMLV